MRNKVVVAVAVVIPLAVTSCSSSPSSDDADDGPPDATAPSDPDAAIGPPPPPDAPPGGAVADPSAPGPWQVGVRTVQLLDPARNRTLPVDVWYPVAPGDTSGGDNTYELLGGFVALDSPARRDATPAPGGPYALVVFSHGYGGIRFQSFFLTEHLASHGLVVVAPDHPGNTLLDFGQLGDDAATAQSAMDRPLDVAFVADRAVAGELGVALPIDPARIAITGHSFGGWTSLEAARRDPRFGVVLPLAPGFRAGSTPDFVAELARPIAIFGGSVDETCPFPSDQQVPYDLAQTPKVLVEVMGAGHLDFSDLCQVPIAQAFIDDGCDPASIDPVVVQARVKTLATAFVRRYVDGAVGYEPYLEPAYAAGLGNLTYWRAP
jgi:predicted dienelactone hydrolase